MKEGLTNNYSLCEAEVILKSCYGEWERYMTKKTARLLEALKAHRRLEKHQALTETPAWAVVGFLNSIRS